MTAGDSLIITQVDPRLDLWSSGDCPRFSNGDGQGAYLKRVRDPDTGTVLDDSVETEVDLVAKGRTACPSDIIGTNWDDFVDQDASGNNLYSERGLIAPFGTLVGGIWDGEGFVGGLFRIGSGFNGVASETGRLRLLYFDVNDFDNAGDVKVRVVARRPISCSFEGFDASTVSTIRAVDGIFYCDAVPEPVLNVKSLGNFPVNVSCCRPDDAPLLNTVDLFVNQESVGYKLQNASTGGACTVDDGQDPPVQGRLESLKIGIEKPDLVRALSLDGNECKNKDPVPAFKLTGLVSTDDGGSQLEFVDPVVQGTKLTGCKGR